MINKTAMMSFTQIFILIVATFAFCWLISDVDKKVGTASAFGYSSSVQVDLSQIYKIEGIDYYRYTDHSVLWFDKTQYVRVDQYDPIKNTITNSYIPPANANGQLPPQSILTQNEFDQYNSKSLVRVDPAKIGQQYVTPEGGIVAKNPNPPVENPAMTPVSSDLPAGTEDYKPLGGNNFLEVKTGNTVTGSIDTNGNFVSSSAAGATRNIMPTGKPGLSGVSPAKGQLMTGNQIGVEGKFTNVADGQTYTFKKVDGELRAFDSSGADVTTEAQSMNFASSRDVSPAPEIPLLGNVGYFWGNAIQGLMWGGAVLSFGMLIGSFVGEKYKPLVNSLSAALGGGIFTGKLTIGILESIGSSQATGASTGTAVPWAFRKGFGGLTNAQGVGIGVGLVTAVIIFIMMYRSSDQKNETKTVIFSCYPWQAPTGVGKAECEKCNKMFNTKSGVKINSTCSKYQCKAMGQNCDIVNEGTGEEMCVYIGLDDTSAPKIIPDNTLFSPNKYFKYEPDKQIRPPAVGVYIWPTDANGGSLTTHCLRPYMPITWGFRTDEPAQCKVSDTLKGTYEEMPAFIGDSNMFSYEHKQTMTLPGPNKSQSGLDMTLNPAQTMKLFVRCADAYGHVNKGADSKGNINYADAFEVQFCIDPAPDNTAPEMKGTSIVDGSSFGFGINDTPVELYTNEPADCKWSKVNQEYDKMENQMSCASDPTEIEANQLYKCTGTLTGLKSGVGVENKVYFKCKDQPWAEDKYRNTNHDPLTLTLYGSEPLTIKRVGPTGNMSGSTTTLNVTLYVETEHGTKDGKAFCYYSTTNLEKDYIMFYYGNLTPTNVHTQQFFLSEGSYRYYLKCLDVGGNVVYNNTQFSLTVDRTAPGIVRWTHDGADKNLKIVTDESANCVYSDQDNQQCNYNFDEATSMKSVQDTIQVTPWIGSQTYYIKCKDKYGNEPSPLACSAVIKAMNDLVQNQ